MKPYYYEPRRPVSKPISKSQQIIGRTAGYAPTVLCIVFLVMIGLPLLPFLIACMTYDGFFMTLGCIVLGVIGFAIYAFIQCLKSSN